MFGLLAQFAPMPPAKPDAPGPFRLAAPGELERVIRAAGFEQVTVESVPCPYGFDSLDQHFQVAYDMAAPFKRAVDAMPPDQVTELRAAHAAVLAPFRTGDGARLSLLTTALCASGRK